MGGTVATLSLPSPAEAIAICWLKMTGQPEQGCGDGINKTQHYANGTPAINAKFPDMAALVK